MKQIGMFLAGACLCVAWCAHGQTVAVVDMEELYLAHPNTASDKKLLEQTRNDYFAERDELRQKLEAMQEDFEKSRKEAQDPAMSDKARKAAEERAGKMRDLLIAADRSATEKVKARQDQLSEMQSRMLKKTIGEIREVVGKYAEEQKLQLVMPAGQVVYSTKALDITAAVMKQMNIQPATKEKEEAAKPDVVKPAPAKPAPAKDKDAAPAATPK